MDLTSIRRRAAALGVSRDIVPKMGEAELIAAIQTAEGFTPCFGSKTTGCRYSKCCWMSECYAEARRIGVRGQQVTAV